MSTVIGINVTLKAKEGNGESGDKCPIEFSFAGNNETARDTLDTSAIDIYLTKVQDNVVLAFYLKTPIVEWKGVEYSASLKSSKNTGPREALWIWRAVGGSEGPYPEHPTKGKDEFHNFKHGATANGDATTEVSSKNQKQEDYYFKLAVYLTDPSGKELTCRHDPRIKNGGLHGLLFGFPKQVVVNMIVGLVALASIAMSLFNLGG